MKTKGFTSTELLVSLFIMSVISTMLISLYLMHHRLYWHVQKKVEEYLEIQWVEELLTQSIRRAGFTPCLAIDQLKVVDTRSLAKNNIQGLSVKQGIQVYRMGESVGEVFQVVNTQQIKTSKFGFIPKKPILIADCYHAEIHEVVRARAIPKGWELTLKKPLVFKYTKEVYIGEWIEEQWYSKKNTTGHWALYYKKEHSEELSPLIHAIIGHIDWSMGKKKVSIQLALSEQEHHFNVLVRS